MDSDLPIALRRTRRSTAGPRAVNGPSERSSTAKSPHKAKRRVRFSDPGPILTHASASSSSSSSTGLTPMIRRTSLARGVTPAKRRRSTPARTTASGSGLGPAASSPLACEVHFEPLRQVLDGRVQRRLRRNGLSEEMNAIHDEKKAAARAADAEIARLRAELREKDAEIYQLQNATIVLDTDRIWALEKELDDLKDQLDNKTVENSRTYAWTLAAKDPFADDCMDSLTDDDDRFGDVTMAELACSTPTRARTSFPTPPLTSPALPKTPSAWRAGVVSLLDPAKQYLEDQVDSMRREMLKLTATLESYTALTSRLTCRLSAFSPPESPATPADQSTHHEPPATPTDHPLEAQLARLLRTTADRSAALITLTSSISSLGFPGSDAAEIAGVERDLAREKERAEGVIDAMRAELERVVSASREMLSQQPAEGGDGEAQGVLSSPLKGGVDGRRGSLLSGDLARRASGRKRRRHDSGMGLLDEDEVDI
ncbi:N2,N2-dimethylguanosine tRNA methyltransferase [Verticillium dahliae VDG1]|nr:N2,N2-dimethylguanosine tRNA methyltransferase [Verticillium dahliae VDG1]